jgi:hypothetical protein
MYAEAAAAVGGSSSSRISPGDFAKLLEAAEEALRCSEAALMELKGHLIEHRCGSVNVRETVAG